MEIKNTLTQLNPYGQPTLNAVGKAGAAPGRTAAGQTGATEGGDRVTLSPEGKLRTEAFSAAMNAPDVRVDKVAELKAQVESGAYVPDSAAIAAKLLTEEPGLFQF